MFNSDARFIVDNSDDDDDDDNAVPPPIRRSREVDVEQVYKRLDYFDLHDSSTDGDHPTQRSRAASVASITLTAFVTPPLPEKTSSHPRRDSRDFSHPLESEVESACNPDFNHSPLAPDDTEPNHIREQESLVTVSDVQTSDHPNHEQSDLPDVVYSNIGNHVTARQRTLSVPDRVAPNLASTKTVNPHPISSPSISPSNRHVLPDRSRAKSLPRQTLSNSPNRSNPIQQSSSKPLPNRTLPNILPNRSLPKPLPNRAPPKPLPNRTPNPVPNRLRHKHNPYLKLHRLPLSLRRRSSLETIDSVTTTPSIVDQDSQNEAEDAGQQDEDVSNTSSSDEDNTGIHDYLAGLANSPHNTRIPSEVYHLSHQARPPPEVYIPTGPHAFDVNMPTRQNQSPEPEYPHTEPATAPEWTISQNEPPPPRRLSPLRLILDEEDFSSDEESSFPSSPSYHNQRHPRPPSRSPPRKPRPSHQTATSSLSSRSHSHSKTIDPQSPTSSPRPSFNAIPAPSVSVSPSSSLFRKLKHKTSRSSNRTTPLGKIKEPLLDPPLHLEINKRVEIDQSSISYRSDSGSSIMTISSGRPEDILNTPRPTSRASGKSGGAASQASVGGSSRSASEWKASTFDTSGLSEAELKKCKKKGINPSLYAEMKAARKGKFVSPIGGNTFL